MNEEETLCRLLEASVEMSLEGSKVVAVPFSGGLDSSVIAFVASKRADVRLYACGLEGSHDIGTARSASRSMGLPLSEIIIEEKDVLEAIPEVERVLGSKDPATVTISLPLYLTTKSVKEGMILGGQGADELFGGYARYTKMKPGELVEALTKDFEELICDKIMGDIKLASGFGKEIRFPYLERSVVDFALYLPLEHKIRGEERKIILRKAAKRFGLPPEICSAPKKAVQFGTGIAPLINRIAKRKKVSLRVFFENGGKSD